MKFPSILTAAALALALPLCAGAATTYPDRPVKMVVPFNAGTTTDLLARIYAEALGGRLGQPVIVENRPGASGSIGTNQVAKATADGYTLLSGTSGSLAVNQTLYPNPEVDLARDLRLISHFGTTPVLLAVRYDSPYQNLGDLLRDARSNPGKLTFASAGNGSGGHLAGELLKTTSKADILHVPFKDGTQALSSVAGGDVDFMFYHQMALKPYFDAKRLRPLAVSGSRRSALAPEVPTVDEAGLPGYEVLTWGGLAVPTGVPADVLETLLTANEAIMADPAVQAKLLAAGLEPAQLSRDEMGRFMAKEIEKWKAVLGASGAKVD